MQNPPNPNWLGTHVAAVVREQDLQVKQDGSKPQNYNTQRQESELESTFDRVADPMHGLSSTNKAQDSQLGPTLTAKVQVESVPTPVERTQQLLKDLQPESETLSEEEKEKWRVFIFKYNHLFALDRGEFGSTNIITHSIDTGDHPPIRQPVRRTPFALRQRVDDLVHEMLNQGVVQPSQSPWASPIVLVKKTVTQDFVWITENWTAAPEKMYFRYTELTTPWTCYLNLRTSPHLIWPQGILVSENGWGVMREDGIYNLFRPIGVQCDAIRTL